MSKIPTTTKTFVVLKQNSVSYEYLKPAHKTKQINDKPFSKCVNVGGNTSTPRRRISDVLIVPLSLLCTSLHDLNTPLAKLRLLDLLSTFARHVCQKIMSFFCSDTCPHRYLDDDTLLQRVIPYVLARPLLGDASGLVRATALRTVSRVVRVFIIIVISCVSINLPFPFFSFFLQA